MEWNSALFVNFVEFRKVLIVNSVHRENLWNIIANYGISKKIITMVKLFYEAVLEHEGKNQIGLEYSLE